MTNSTELNLIVLGKRNQILQINNGGLKNIAQHYTWIEITSITISELYFKYEIRVQIKFKNGLHVISFHSRETSTEIETIIVLSKKQ